MFAALTVLTLLNFLTLALEVPPAPSIALPGGPPVGMDYLVFDATNGRVWVPAGNTGNVDVIDTKTRKVTPLGGFRTAPSRRSGRPGVDMGPSSVAIADGAVWVGNRGDDTLCSFDARTLAKGPCRQLASMPDGLAYVGATRELWATTPRDNTITIVGVGEKPPAPAHPDVIRIDGTPEGYAVDGARGLFYTNLEDKDRTLAFDVKTRKQVASWAPGCGAEGPRGLALDGARRLLFVACTDGAVVLDLAHDGKVAGRLKTGGGVDNIDYHAGRRLLYVASAAQGTLTIARVADGGALAAVATVPTAKGARNPVVDAAGTAYVADTPGGRLIVIEPVIR
jgi:DNA-binding beta-propeller fold protein YncE